MTRTFRDKLIAAIDGAEEARVGAERNAALLAGVVEDLLAELAELDAAAAATADELEQARMLRMVQQRQMADAFDRHMARRI